MKRAQIASVTHLRSAQSVAPSPSSSIPLSQISRIVSWTPVRVRLTMPSLPAWNAWTMTLYAPGCSSGIE